MPPPDIIECTPVPRLQLVVVLRINPVADPAQAALSVARFISTLQAADRKLRLTVDGPRSTAVAGEVTLVFTPGLWSVLVAERLAKVAELVREAIAAFEGASLVRVEVAQQS